MISIIIPIYNASKYLPSCVESVLAQTYKDFELILINDGSTDDSKQICEFYESKDSRITFIDKPNSGVGDTRNVGLKQAKGEWICFIDADDYVSEDYLSTFDIDNTKADIVYSGVEITNIVNNQSLRKVTFADEKHYPVDAQTIINLLPVGFPIGKAYRKSFWNKNEYLFKTDIFLHEDHVFVLDCLEKSSNIETKSKITYYYRIDFSNSSLSKKKHPAANLLKASDYLFESLERIRRKYNLTVSDTAEFNTFCYEPRITAVLNLYSEGVGAKERKNIIKNSFNGKYNISELYKPKGLKGKMVKNIYRFSPLLIADFLLLLLAKAIDYKHNA